MNKAQIDDMVAQIKTKAKEVNVTYQLHPNPPRNARRHWYLVTEPNSLVPYQMVFKNPEHIEFYVTFRKELITLTKLAPGDEVTDALMSTYDGLMPLEMVAMGLGKKSTDVT